MTPEPAHGQPGQAQPRFVRLEPGHIEALVPIEREAYPEPWTVGMFRDECHNPRSRFFVMYLDTEIAGYGGYWLVVDEAHITSVTVRDVYRSCGYGLGLMQFLMQSAAAEGARVATLEVRASNSRARTLYERMGFQSVGVRKGYYRRKARPAAAEGGTATPAMQASDEPEDAIVMLKEIA